VKKSVKVFFFVILSVSTVILLVYLMLGCATIPSSPLQPDEVRLTDLKIIKTGFHGGERGSTYKVIIRYQHGKKIAPGNITSACTTLTWLGDV
jgi:hypothetical protein